MSYRAYCIAVVLVGCAFVRVSSGEESASAAPRQLKSFKLQNITPQESMAAVQTLLAIRPTRPANSASPPAAIAVVTPPAVAIDEKAKTLFVRATNEQIAEIQKLLQAIDQPLEKLSEVKLETADLLPVKNVPVRQVQAVLQQLQIPCQVMQLGTAGVIVMPTDPANKEHVAQAKEVLKTLDVKSDTKVAAKPVSDE